MIRLLTLLVAMVFGASAVSAQTAQPATVQFVGTITGSAAETLMVRGSDGVISPWTGPLPDFPYMTGDQVTVSFTAKPGQATTSTDGIYRYTIIGQSQTGSSSGTGFALMSGPDISGPITPSGINQSTSGLVLVYDSNTGSYAIDIPTGSYAINSFGSPSFTYDPLTGSLTSRPLSPMECDGHFYTCATLLGGWDNATLRNIPVQAPDGGIMGWFSLNFSGSWFVNGQQVGGNSVPEPGQLVLFALALVAFGWAWQRRLVRQPAVASA